MDIFEEISGIDDGSKEQEANEGLAAVVEKVRQLMQPGTVTITLTVKPTISQNQIATKISAKVKVKLPEAPPAERIRFVGKDGELTSENPAQARLPFQSVDPSTTTRGVAEAPMQIRSV